MTEDVADGEPGDYQGIALQHGAGRVYASGEAAMFTAQALRAQQGAAVYYCQPAGMQLPSNDNEELLRNIVYWLNAPE